MEKISVGSIVRFEAPGSRTTEGQPRLVPAIVLRQWDTGDLQLYAFHFEGSFLVHSIPVGQVQVVIKPDEFDRRLTDLETIPKPQPKKNFYVVDEAAPAR